MKNLVEFDYLKELENNVETHISDDQYIIARLDGNNFHTYTKGMDRPFDATLKDAMTSVTEKLVEHFNVTVAYVQSDEITLIWQPRMNRNNTGLVEHPRSGRVLKLSTLLSSYCTLEFYKLIKDYKEVNYNGFDCRMYGGDRTAALDSLRFRMIDAASNAYQAIAQSMWSQKELQNVSIQQIKQKLIDQGINVWDSYGDECMTGAFFYKLASPENERMKIFKTDGGVMMKRINEGSIFA